MGSLRTLAARLGHASPPLLAWVVATTTMAVVSWQEGWPPFAAEKTWARWDSGLYLSIAQHGYNLFPCTPGTTGGDWCGNGGWFPAYPWIVGALSHLGLPLGPTALSVSWLACAGTLVVLWKAFPTGRPSSAAVALVYAAFAPGVVYNYALFPLSLLSLGTVSALALLQRDRWVAAGFAAALAALAYPVGLAAAAGGAVWLLGARSVDPLERLRRVVPFLWPSALAMVVFALVEQIETGHWNAYLLIQRKYAHHLQEPFAGVSAAWRTARQGSTFQLAHAPALQMLFVTFVLACVLIELALRRGPNLRNDALVGLWAIAAWLLPIIETDVSAYRGEAALLPLALLIRRLPLPLATVIAAVAIVLSVPMTKLFLRNVLM